MAVCSVFRDTGSLAGDIRLMRIHNLGPRDVLAVAVLFMCALAAGFFYHADNWAAFCDILRTHIDVNLYYPPLGLWGKDLSGTADLPARYALFQMPKGYLFLNWILFGAVPLFVQTKILPVFVSLVALYYFYRLMRCYVNDVAAFFASLVLCLHSWTFHVYQALCPRAFFYPLLLAFLYYFQQKRYVVSAVIYCAQCLFYPPAAAISLGVVVLMKSEGLFSARNRMREALHIVVLGVTGVLVAVVLHYVQYNKIEDREFGPVISYAQMKILPEFQEGGKESFFYQVNDWEQWLMSKRAGIGMNMPLGVLIVLSVVLWGAFLRSRDRQGVPWIFKAVSGSSAVLFLAAYGILFVLYYPARYAMFTIPLVISVWFGCGVSNVIQSCSSAKRANILAGLLFCWIMAGYGVYLVDARTDTRRGGMINYHYVENVISYFKGIESNGLVAAPPYIADALPLYAHKRVLFSDRFLIPFQQGYRKVMEERLSDFYRAYYAVSKDVVKNFCQQYQVDFLVVDLTDFQDDKRELYRKDKGPYAAFAPQSRDFIACVLPAVIGEARVYEDGRFIVIDGNKL